MCVCVYPCVTHCMRNALVCDLRYVYGDGWTHRCRFNRRFSTISQSRENNYSCRWMISEIFRIFAHVGKRNGSLEDCRTPQSKIFECDRNWLFDCKSFRKVIWWHSVLSYITTFSHAPLKYLCLWCKDIQSIVIFCLFLSASWHPLNFLFLTCNLGISSNWSSVALEKIAEQITWKFFFFPFWHGINGQFTAGARD